MAITFNAPSIAPNSGQEFRRIRITHPFHPLNGKQFDLVEHRCIYAESYVYFNDDRGQLREIPSAWTDFVKEDAFAEVAAGRSPLHSAYLLELVDWVERLKKGLGGDA